MASHKNAENMEPIQKQRLAEYVQDDGWIAKAEKGIGKKKLNKAQTGDQ